MKWFTPELVSLTSNAQSLTTAYLATIANSNAVFTTFAMVRNLMTLEDSIITPTGYLERVY